MSKFLLLVGLLSLLFVFQGIASVSGQTLDYEIVKNQSNPKYKIIRSECVGDTFLLVVVIKPKYLNREDMTALAKKIKIDFPKENKIEVVFFTNKHAAKNLIINEHSKDYEKNKEALRASYRLNRLTGEEYLSFAPIGRKAREIEEIDLSKSN